jgi:multidrug efflux pump subunit AcrB
VEEIKSLSSNSNENFSSISVRFEDTITSEAGSKIVSEIIKSSSDLPESVEPSIITFEATKFNGKYDMIVSLLDINNSSDLVALQTNAGELATELAKNDLVMETAVIELLTKQVNEQTGQEFLYQNSFDRTGFIKSEELEMFQSIQIGIIKKEDTNIDDLSESVSADIEKFNNENSEYESIITGDFSELVNSQIKSLEENALSGLIAVVLIIFFFISWRASILGGIFIPTVLAATFIVFYLIGYSLNVISLFALILVIGILTDDAIIVIEAIDKKKRAGLGKIDAIKSAINEIGVADIVGSVTTILVFIPMVFTSGILGDFIRLVPITVIIALTLSLVIALTFIPYLSGIITFDLDIITKRIRFPKIPFVSSFFYYLFNGVGILIEKSASLNAKFVSAYLSKKRFLVVILIASLVLILGGGFFASKLKFSVFPAPKDTDQITAQVSFQEGTKIETAEEMAIKVEDLILNSEYKEFVEQITYTTGNERRAEMSLNLTPIGSRSVTSVDMINGLTSDVESSDSFEGVDIRFSIVSAGPPAQEYPFAMQIYSESTEVLDVASKDISSYLLDLELDNGNEITAVRVDGIELILRKDGKRFAEVRAKTTDPSDTALTLSIQRSVEAEYSSEKLLALGVEEPLGFDLGQESENLESFQSAVIAFGVAIVIMFLLLVLLYNSYSQAVLIFLAIPFSIPFLFPGLYLTDNPLSFFVTLGMIALVGIKIERQWE